MSVQVDIVYQTIDVQIIDDEVINLAIWDAFTILKNGQKVGVFRSIDFEEGPNITLDVTDEGAVAKVKITGQAGGGGSAHVIQNSGTPLTQRANLNFTDGLSATDDSGNNSSVVGIAADGVTDTKLRNSVGVSVIGRAANSTGDPADIVAGANDRILRRASDVVGFGQLTVGMAPNNVWTYDKIQQVTALRLLGNPTWGAANVSEISLGTGLEFSGTTIRIPQSYTNQFWNLASGGTLTGPNEIIGSAANSFIMTFNAMGTTPGAGIYLRNTTAAANGAQQYSPFFIQDGRGWATDSGGSSKQVAYASYLVPVQGAAAPTAMLTWASSIDGGAYQERMRLNNLGYLGLNVTPTSRFHVKQASESSSLTTEAFTWERSGSTSSMMFGFVNTGVLLLTTPAGINISNSSGTMILGTTTDLIVRSVNSGGAGAFTIAMFLSQTVFQIDRFGRATFTGSSTVPSSGTGHFYTWISNAPTNQTASTEIHHALFNFSNTLQFATGAHTILRTIRVQNTTYAFVGASTITDAITFSIDGPPTAGTNATITRAWAAAYNGNVLIGATAGTTGNILLELQSSSRALLLSRVGTEGNITTAVNGMIYYNSTDEVFRGRLGSSSGWGTFAMFDRAMSATSISWTLSGSVLIESGGFILEGISSDCEIRADNSTLTISTGSFDIIGPLPIGDPSVADVWYQDASGFVKISAG